MYVKRHHLAKQIIGEKDARPMTRRSSRRSTCLVSTFEPKIASNALEDKDWISTMNKEIEKIERNKT